MQTVAKLFVIDDVLIREISESLIQSLGYDTEAFSSADDYLNCGYILDAACLIRCADARQDWIRFAQPPTHRRLQHTYRFHECASRGSEAGAVSFLDKRVNVGDLIDCLNKALKSHSS